LLSCTNVGETEMYFAELVSVNTSLIKWTVLTTSIVFYIFTMQNYYLLVFSTGIFF